MGKRGTKTLPVELHKARRTYRPVRHSQKVKMQTVDSVPEPPETLNEDGRKIWIGFLSYASEVQGYIAKTELPLVEQMACAYQEWIEAERILKTEGRVVVGSHGGDIVSPWRQIAKMAHETYYKIMREFGATPTTRTGIKLIQMDTSEDFADI